MRQLAIDLIEKIEDGRMSSSDAYMIIERLDPLLAYFCLRFLREKYSHQSGSAAINCITEIVSTYEDVKKMMKEGAADPMNEWFDDGYTVREYSADPDGYVDLIIEKLES